VAVKNLATTTTHDEIKSILVEARDAAVSITNRKWADPLREVSRACGEFAMKYYHREWLTPATLRHLNVTREWLNNMSSKETYVNRRVIRAMGAALPVLNDDADGNPVQKCLRCNTRCFDFWAEWLVYLVSVTDVEIDEGLVESLFSAQNFERRADAYDNLHQHYLRKCPVK